MKTALLVVDIQNDLIENMPYQMQNCLSIWQQLITNCREKDVEVIYVRHHDEELVFGSHGWKIYDGVAPKAGEKIFDKQYNSAFKENSLQEYLASQAFSHLVIIGMATDYCIDTTVKVAFELGYQVTIPKNGTTTFDSDFLTAKQLQKHYEAIWHNRFAKVKTIEEILKEDLY